MGNFFFSELNNGGWLERCFDSFHLFGYIGDRDRLERFQKEKSIARRLFETVAPKISLTSVIGKLSGINIGLGKSDSAIAKAIIDLINEVETKRQIDEFLRRTQDKCAKAQLYFDSIGAQFNRKSSVAKANQGEIQNKLIVVEAQLLNRNSVAQFANDSWQQLAASKNEWLLSDFPPCGLSSDNDLFKGNLLRLEQDEGFADAFSSYLPFARDIGWYPYCRITGFYDASTVATEIFPKISVCFVEYRLPKLYQDISQYIYDFLAQEMRNLIYLRDIPDQVVAAYMLPIVAKRSGLNSYRVPAAHRLTIEKFVQFLGHNMPEILREWYQRAL